MNENVEKDLARSGGSALPNFSYCTYLLLCKVRNWMQLLVLWKLNRTPLLNCGI